MRGLVNSKDYLSAVSRCMRQRGGIGKRQSRAEKSLREDPGDPLMQRSGEQTLSEANPTEDEYRDIQVAVSSPPTPNIQLRTIRTAVMLRLALCSD